MIEVCAHHFLLIGASLVVFLPAQMLVFTVGVMVFLLIQLLKYFACERFILVDVKRTRNNNNNNNNNENSQQMNPWKSIVTRDTPYATVPVSKWYILQDCQLKFYFSKKKIYTTRGDRNKVVGTYMYMILITCNNNLVGYYSDSFIPMQVSCFKYKGLRKT